MGMKKVAFMFGRNHGNHVLNFSITRYVVNFQLDISAFILLAWLFILEWDHGVFIILMNFASISGSKKTSQYTSDHMILFLPSDLNFDDGFLQSDSSSKYSHSALFTFEFHFTIPASWLL